MADSPPVLLDLFMDRVRDLLRAARMLYADETAPAPAAPAGKQRLRHGPSLRSAAWVTFHGPLGGHLLILVAPALTRAFCSLRCDRC